MGTPAVRVRPRKWPLFLLPSALTGVVVAIVIVPWMHRLDMVDPSLSLLARTNSLIWTVVLAWAVHHLVFQLAALFKVPGSTKEAKDDSKVRFVVVYLTCDDFQEQCCESCVNQEYPSELFRVIIGDDSQRKTTQHQVDCFVRQHSGVECIRRPNRRGFKAGNLNNIFSKSLKPDEEWVVVVDADQSLPDTYLTQLAPVVAAQGADVAFVQAANEPGKEATPFQAVLGTEVVMFYQRDLSWRQRCGLVPWLGHGAALRKSIWRRVGRFPEVVSEDYAYSLRASNRGAYGAYVETVRSKESFPKDFGAFLVRLRKFAGGSAELLCHEAIRYLIRKAPFAEKLDFVMLLLWYPLMPFVLGNGFLSAYVCHRLWELEVAALHPVLPFLFLAMFLLPFPVIASSARGWGAAVRYWFWCTAIYGASLPFATVHFVISLARRPSFEPTPKRGRRSPRFHGSAIGTVSLGVVALAAAWVWWSPFSPVLGAYGMAYICFPLYHRLNADGLSGALARLAAIAPGSMLAFALYTMWLWGRF